MIERLCFSVAIALAAVAIGLLVRAFARRRVATRSASILVSSSDLSQPKLLVFSSKWCSDCETQRVVIEESRDSWSQAVEISYHDAVSESDLAGRFGILIVPALVVASADGRVVGVRQGLVDEDRLRSLIEAAA